MEAKHYDGDPLNNVLIAYTLETVANRTRKLVATQLEIAVSGDTTGLQSPRIPYLYAVEIAAENDSGITWGTDRRMTVPANAPADKILADL